MLTVNTINDINEFLDRLLFFFLFYIILQVSKRFDWLVLTKFEFYFED